MHSLFKKQQQQQHTNLAKKILWTENFKNHEETYMYSCARASPFAIAKNTKKRWKILASLTHSLTHSLTREQKKKTVTNDLMMTFTPAHT
jgi:hypothetical protein